MTRAEKAGYEAYPENIGYSTIADVMYDYNAEKRRVYIAGHKKGYKEATDKLYEWLRTNHDEIFLRYVRGYNAGDEIELLKKYMEGQQ